MTKSNSYWEEFFGPNLGYIHDLYEKYMNDPASVDENLKEQFEKWGEPPITNKKISNDNASQAEEYAGKTVQARKLIQNIRTHGHLAADIYPIERGEKSDTSFLELSKYNLTQNDLEKIPAKIVWENSPETIRNAKDAVTKLKELYTQTIAFEFSHIHDEKERDWLNLMVESGALLRDFSNDERRNLLNRLMEVDGFEKFLHKTFVAQKRFSIEGLDSMVPMLDKIVESACLDKTSRIMVGMAHRGRLNVLAHVLGKPYELIFSEFAHSPNKDLIPSEGSMGINYGWSGDVKYHLGANRNVQEDDEVCATITLANNPSHLEFVNPVVEGFTRAAQENRSNVGYPSVDTQASFSILIHGDAAFPGEGIVAETLNLSQLKGYETGGTIHIIANNLLGFTTDYTDSRSTRYASDVAKGYEIPIIHVNADDPEACLASVNLAYEYRKKFKKDILIDLIGYRRYGHNEMDDPSATQPKLYKAIESHPIPAKVYFNRLVKKGLVEEGFYKNYQEKIEHHFREQYERINVSRDEKVEEHEVPKPVAEGIPLLKTNVELAKLKSINEELLKWPDDFTVYPKLEKILKRREKALDKHVDWAHAETLAFASILADGTPIRLTGQDSERGTFAHRHIVLHDVNTNRTHSPLHTIPQAKASFSIHNSPLSEASVLGFEYGYSIEAEESLVIWEAQYGDFVNAAQVVIDQFIAAGRAKWGQKSSLVMLLPHGYEGQGPEHSSGRLERFLQLAGENNWTVANLTSAAQYFHILRRQAKITTKSEARPLIIMTPKSLIRNSHTNSKSNEFSEGAFSPVIKQRLLGEEKEKVKRILLGSGKIMIDIETKIEDLSERNWDWLHVLRIEELHPFPQEIVRELIDQYPNLEEIFWVQEEPMNMGAWTYIKSKIDDSLPKHLNVTYIGRPERSSPAAGDPKIHKMQQERILLEALNLEQGGRRNERG